MSVNQGRFSGGFWGLVEQKGPWKSTPSDKARSTRTQPNKKTGGGIQIGGTKNAGHAGWYASMNPSVEPNALPPPPRPSQYVQKSIVMPSIMMPKTPKGTILRNAPVETMKAQSVGVQKPGNTYTPHFQPSEVEATREGDAPSLMSESSSGSDGSPVNSQYMEEFAARVHKANRPPQYEFGTQTDINDDTLSEAEFNQQMFDDFRAHFFPTRPTQQELGTQTETEINDVEMQTARHTRDNAMQTDTITKKDAIMTSDSSTQYEDRPKIEIKDEIMDINMPKRNLPRPSPTESEMEAELGKSKRTKLDGKQYEDEQKNLEKAKKLQGYITNYNTRIDELNRNKRRLMGINKSPQSDKEIVSIKNSIADLRKQILDWKRQIIELKNAKAKILYTGD